MNGAPSRTITRNAVRCKTCGDIIESRTVHELVMCSCGACGVDGGLEYLRRLGDPEAYEELSEFMDASAVTPKQSMHGLLAEYGPGPSEKEIDENRREMFRRFAEDDQSFSA
jgi:hypothetical protein